MKKIILIFSIFLLIISCGKKEPSYQIYTRDEKKLIYKEAKDNENQEKLKEIQDLMNTLEIEGKKGDKTAYDEFYELCQNTRDFSREMNGIFFVYKKFEIVKYIWYNKNGDK